MNATFSQVPQVSYVWLGHALHASGVQSAAKAAAVCSRCNVAIAAVMSFCLRCGHMARRSEVAAAPRHALAPRQAAMAALPRIDPAWSARMGLAAGACVIALAGTAAAYQGMKFWDWGHEADAHTVSIPVEERGIIDSFSERLPLTMTTLAGELTRVTNADGTRHVALDGAALSHGKDGHWQFPVRAFQLADDRQAILMASSGGHGYNCETKFYFLMADRHGMQRTPMFGTCAPRITFRRLGDHITLLFPRIGGLSTVKLEGGALTEDSISLVLNDANDPFK